jgi:hypothetical protein
VQQRRDVQELAVVGLFALLAQALRVNARAHHMIEQERLGHALSQLGRCLAQGAIGQRNSSHFSHHSSGWVHDSHGTRAMVTPSALAVMTIIMQIPPTRVMLS